MSKEEEEDRLMEVAKLSGEFSVFLLLLISGFVLLWSEKTLDMILILNLIRLALWPNM